MKNYAYLTFNVTIRKKNIFDFAATYGHLLNCSGSQIFLINGLSRNPLQKIWSTERFRIKNISFVF